MEAEQYCISTERSVTKSEGYQAALNHYLLGHAQLITGNLGLSSHEVGLPSHLTLSELAGFVVTICKSAATYAVEKKASQASYYSSARGAVWSRMSLEATQTPFLDGWSINPAATEVIGNSHLFRGIANLTDAIVDESDQPTGRAELTSHQAVMPTTQIFLSAKGEWYRSLKDQNQRLACFQTLAKNSRINLGDAARRFQFHQDSYFDLAALRQVGLSQTQYLVTLPEPGIHFPFSREELAHLVVMGLDAETLFVDSAVAVRPELSSNDIFRTSAFWTGVTGALGDFWADILQDQSKGVANICADFINNFSGLPNLANDILEPYIAKAQPLIDNPTQWNRRRFWFLQQQARRQLKKAAPEAIGAYGTIINQAFSQIAPDFKGHFTPIRLGSWDLMPIYQLSDFAFHKDRYEQMV